jgi:hypothetical protein
MQQFHYGLKARPAAPGAVPRDIEFSVVDRAHFTLPEGYSDRDVRHGILVTKEPLTDKQIYDYELVDLKPKPPVATFISDLTVIDPETGLDVQVSIYKNTVTGAVFGVDTSYVVNEDGDGGVIVKDFISGDDILLEE